MTAGAAVREAVAVVTGGARGLGNSLAESFARRGMSVALLDVLEDTESVAQALAEDHGVAALGVRTDVTDQSAVEASFARVREVLGLPTVLLTAAGVTAWKDSVDVTADEWRKVISVNLDGTFFAAQSFARGLFEQERAGTAVFIASMSGSIVNVPQRQASYNASKAAVAHLAKSLAVEWALRGIRVNSISPGYFLSDMTRQFTDRNPDLAREWIAKTPLGRMGEPRDLHGLIEFLTSDASCYVTGQDLVVDGGYTIV